VGKGDREAPAPWLTKQVDEEGFISCCRLMVMGEEGCEMEGWFYTGAKGSLLGKVFIASHCAIHAFLNLHPFPSTCHCHCAIHAFFLYGRSVSRLNARHLFPDLGRKDIEGQ
jgi:hypothetical protein